MHSAQSSESSEEVAVETEEEAAKAKPAKRPDADGGNTGLFADVGDNAVHIF